MANNLRDFSQIYANQGMFSVCNMVESIYANQRMLAAQVTSLTIKYY